MTQAQHIILPARLDRAGLVAFSQQLDNGIAAGKPLVLTGAAPGIFCSGLDLDHQQVDMQRAQDFAALLIRVWEAPAPTIAVVDGPAIGGGLGLAAACDLVISTDQATFALPELLWGFVPAMIWPLITTRIAGPTARWWILSGHARTATEAHAAGLVNEIVAANKMTTLIQRRVRECRRADTSAIPILRQLAGPDVAAAIRAGASITAERLATPHVQQRLAAYAAGDVPW
jgi:enoyl-CoA hydratase/carnithine racemase